MSLTALSKDDVFRSTLLVARSTTFIGMLVCIKPDHTIEVCGTFMGSEVWQWNMCTCFVYGKIAQLSTPVTVHNIEVAVQGGKGSVGRALCFESPVQGI